MGIKANIGSIQLALKKFKEDAEKQIVKALSQVGEEFVDAAKNQPQDHALRTYLDDTKALRSSVGYFLLKDGKIIKSKISAVGGGKLSSVGVATSIRIVESMPVFEGYRLVGIAGMNYASYVESKGYNVISTQKELAFINLKEYFNAA